MNPRGATNGSFFFGGGLYAHLLLFILLYGQAVLRGMNGVLPLIIDFNDTEL